MTLAPVTKLFGSSLRTRVLVALAMMEESFPSELARVIKAPLFSVQRVVDGLESEGILATRKPGLERRVTLNPRYFAAPQLKQLLDRLGEADSTLRSELESRRVRPRRRKKPL
jgi:hypothetical protein